MTRLMPSLREDVGGRHVRDACSDCRPSPGSDSSKRNARRHASSRKTGAPAALQRAGESWTSAESVSSAGTTSSSAGQLLNVRTSETGVCATRLSSAPNATDAGAAKIDDDHRVLRQSRGGEAARGETRVRDDLEAVACTGACVSASMSSSDVRSVIFWYGAHGSAVGERPARDDVGGVDVGRRGFAFGHRLRPVRDGDRRRPRLRRARGRKERERERANRDGFSCGLDEKIGRTSASCETWLAGVTRAK